jgi:hypothetical protein
MDKLTIIARWDDFAEVWTATSKDVHGLATSAPTMQELKKKLKICVPELMELNGSLPKEQSDIMFHFLMRGDTQEVIHIN